MFSCFLFLGTHLPLNQFKENTQLFSIVLQYPSLALSIIVSRLGCPITQAYLNYYVH